MTQLTAYARSLAFPTLLAATAVGFSSAANAAADYDGYADFSIVLDSVLFQGPGAPEGTDWSVSSSGVIVDSGTDSGGGGAANIDTGIDAARSWSVGDEGLVQYSESYGDLSGDGLASSFADTEFSIDVVNNSDAKLKFSFSFDAFVSADISADAGENIAAYASIDLFDDKGLATFISADVFADAYSGGFIGAVDELSQALLFTLNPGETNTIHGNVYSDGYAEKVSEVPLPAAAWLFGSGLLALAGLQRKS
jgi:hypothetical protein